MSGSPLTLIPKLTVRVRFSSPAPSVEAQARAVILISGLGWPLRGVLLLLADMLTVWPSFAGYSSTGTMAPWLPVVFDQRRTRGPSSAKGLLDRNAATGKVRRPRPSSHRLSEGLLDDLQAWGDAWDSVGPGTTGEVIRRALQERGRQPASRLQDELGTGRLGSAHRSDGRVHRVHRPGSWPARTWHEELLGYAPRDQQRAEEDGRVRQAILNRQKRADVDGSASTEP